MKKFFVSFAAVIFAATSFAQGIELEKTINGYWLEASSMRGMLTSLGMGQNGINQLDCRLFDDCLYTEYVKNSYKEEALYWWDENYTQHTVQLEKKDWFVREAVRNLFTDDNRMCFLIYATGKYTYTGDWRVIDEFGSVLIELSDADYAFVVYLFGEYKLITYGYTTGSTQVTKIYSLPGQGKIFSDNKNIQSTPRNGHKYIKDAQVLIEEDDRTYNMTGLRVK